MKKGERGRGSSLRKSEEGGMLNNLQKVQWETGRGG